PSGRSNYSTPIKLLNPLTPVRGFFYRRDWGSILVQEPKNSIEPSLKDSPLNSNRLACEKISVLKSFIF
ncbi:MAG: hypothetical protein ACPGC5_07075, partial [Flavobacteriaceae bacterium]